MENNVPESGVCVWLTGLSGAGKTTLSEATFAKISPSRDAVKLDGDDIRRMQSNNLGFSFEDRVNNAIFAAELAASETRIGKIVLASLISPYEVARQAAKHIIELAGSHFVLVHVATPLEICEQRDPKNLYKMARAGQITSFTGIDDPYEVPVDADITIDTTEMDSNEASDIIVYHLASNALLHVS